MIDVCCWISKESYDILTSHRIPISKKALRKSDTVIEVIEESYNIVTQRFVCRVRTNKSITIRSFGDKYISYSEDISYSEMRSNPFEIIFYIENLGPKRFTEIGIYELRKIHV